MASPLDWAAEHWEAMTGAGGGLALALRRVFQIEGRIGVLEEKNKALEEGLREEIAEIKHMLKEQDQRTAQFWRVDWPKVVASATRLDAIERVCLRLEQDFDSLTRKG